MPDQHVVVGWTASSCWRAALHPGRQGDEQRAHHRSDFPLCGRWSVTSKRARPRQCPGQSYLRRHLRLGGGDAAGSARSRSRLCGGGYDAPFSAAITARRHHRPHFSSERAMVIFGGLTGTSIAASSSAAPFRNRHGRLPDGASYLLPGAGYPARPAGPPGFSGFPQGLLAVLSPVIVLGGIVTGVTTPTERPSSRFCTACS